MKAFLNSLKGRVFLLSVLATFLVILVSSLIFSIERARYTAELQQDFLVDYALFTLREIQESKSNDVAPGETLAGDVMLPETMVPAGQTAAIGDALVPGLPTPEQEALFWDAKFWVEPRYTLNDLPDADGQSRLKQALRAALPDKQVSKVFIKQPEVFLGGSSASMANSGMMEHALPESALIISLLLNDGRALNIMPVFSAQQGVLWDRELLLLIAALFICMVLINLWAATWMTRPLADMEKAAARFGRDLDAPLLPETGVTEVAQAGKAFNRMQQQITGLIEGRTAMLAAISHDLRTPMTRLRLRTELLQDKTVKADIERDLQDITAMVDATLGFLRNDALAEAVESVNLTALVRNYCAERQAVGDAVVMADFVESCEYSLRPLAIKRALGNLIDNGLHYGGDVTVSLHYDTDWVVISVCDNGPGIPEHLQPEVVKPFVRAEQSRNRDTGGVGLGLSIVISIMELHGGELRLENTADGFCALMVLKAKA
ncbi:MAG: ATP-binding protein [Thiolinea sp.]